MSIDRDRVLGGQPIDGVTIGILMLETRFPRPHGDGGNALTWPFPMLFRVVREATPERVIVERAEGLLPVFEEAAKSLVADGVRGIVTNCGFLSLYQAELARAAGVPVASSSLIQVPWVQSLLRPEQQVGVLTISPANLSAEHLRAAGIPGDIPIGGPDRHGAFAGPIIGDELEMDVMRARSELIDSAHSLVSQYPDIGALVLECTNMCPHARAIQASISIPVYDFYSFVTWFHAGLDPRRFEFDSN